MEVISLTNIEILFYASVYISDQGLNFFDCTLCRSTIIWELKEYFLGPGVILQSELGFGAFGLFVKKIINWKFSTVIN